MICHPSRSADHSTLSANAALDTTETPELLALDEDMRAFVDQYVTCQPGLPAPAPRKPCTAACAARPFIGIDYDPSADGTAAEAFHSEFRGKGRCLTYAHLFIAMARHAGLDARYLSVSLRPEWSRHGEQVALRKHVNVVVRLRNGEAVRGGY